MEASDCSDCIRHWPGFYGLNLSFIHLNPITGNHIPMEDNPWH